MPTYEYQREDGTTFEVEQKITEDALTQCPTTGQPVVRLISATSFQLKGSGWYKTDYAKSSSGSNSNTSDNEKQSSSETVKTEEKSSDSTTSQKKEKTPDAKSKPVAKEKSAPKSEA